MSGLKALTYLHALEPGLLPAHPDNVENAVIGMKGDARFGPRLLDIHGTPSATIPWAPTRPRKS